MAAIGFVDYATQKEAFFAALDAGFAPLLPTSRQYELDSQYRKAYYGDGFQDLSFIMTLDGTPSAGAFYHKYGATESGYNASGAEIHVSAHGETKKITKEILDRLIMQAKASGLTTIRVRDDESSMGSALGLIGTECLNYGGGGQLKLCVTIDLAQDQEAIFAAVRKRYKSMINKGLREISLSYMTKENADPRLFAEFENFHLTVAGKKTRSEESWNIQYDMIKEGCAELIMGHMSPHGLVSSALFTDMGPATHYAVAVYDRNLFDMPLAHANVYEGILRAKKRGQKTFHLGIIPMPGEGSEKEQNIAKFKRGFAQKVTFFIEWTISLQERGEQTYGTV